MCIEKRLTYFTGMLFLLLLCGRKQFATVPFRDIKCRNGNYAVNYGPLNSRLPEKERYGKPVALPDSGKAIALPDTGKGMACPDTGKVPKARTIAWRNSSSFADSIYSDWAGKRITAAMLKGKGNAPRILLAKMLTGRDIPEANQLLMKYVPWGISGSSWALNKKGDYDFTITIFTTLLWFWGDRPEILYPEARDHLLHVLLTEDGSKFRSTAPRTLGLAKETENHILMTEGSRYLKNRWIMLHGNKDPYFDNAANGMEAKLLTVLEELKTGGLYEFNSLPYIGYTITALLNLEAFGSAQVRNEARDVLDHMNWCYALGSYKLKHYPPMRRRYDKAGNQALTTGYQSVFMKAWLSYAPVEDFNKPTDNKRGRDRGSYNIADSLYNSTDTPDDSVTNKLSEAFTLPDSGYNKNIKHGEVHALMGACMPYRPADKVVSLIFNKGNGYFVKIGHGAGACPEIFSAGKDYLLSAGGANRGKRSLIVARPICLFLNDTAEYLSSVIHLAGPGAGFMSWNNTGVFKRFACAAGPVFVPSSFQALQIKGDWSIYAKDSLLIAVYSTPQFGLLALFEPGYLPLNAASVRGYAARLLSLLIQANPDADRIRSCFKFPDGRELTFDAHAPKNKWVITSENGQKTNRDFDKWPLLECTGDQ